MASKKKRKRTQSSTASSRVPKGKAKRPVVSDSIAPTEAGENGDRFPIVGLGASAGGLKALEAFFENMPADSGMGFVVITHQHAKHPSMLSELLSRKTRMPVIEVSNATRVEPNHVYTVHPGYKVAMLHGVLQPLEIDSQTPLHLYMPIDYFFRSLARDQKDRAIGIILSGTGSDGSLGLREIKAETGMTLVQEECSAQFRGMPHSAIATELVDYVLPAEQLPKQLLAFAETCAPGKAHEMAKFDTPQESLQQIFVLIRDQSGHDFSQYKRSTIRRRIERRMTIHQIESVERYVSYLQANPAEVEQLSKELLIGVTSFFRDPDAWTALSTFVDKLLGDKPEDYVVRAWVPGCSTGEEAYSLAILLRERLDALKRPLGVQIFATDLDVAAIDLARVGTFPFGISNDVSPTRLAQFFTRDDDTYQVKKVIREMVIFAPQDVIADPPFTKLDLLSCRNLLIYFDASLQKRVVPIFHYALKPHGLLFLGSSESIGMHTDLFTPVDKKWKIYQRNSSVRHVIADFPPAVSNTRIDTALPNMAEGPSATHGGMKWTVDRMLLKDLVPPTVLVQRRGDVVHVHGDTGLFLQPPQGSPAAANIFNMARHGLELVLSSCIRQAAAADNEIVQRGVHVGTNGGTVSVDIHVLKLKEPESLRGLFRIAFEAVHQVSETKDPTSWVETELPNDQMSELEQELRHSRESHQGAVEELETSNEELQSTNEELQSTNEELQSANEELQTSKEEMQSLNEELQTVNNQLQERVEELSHTNNDMKNLLNAPDIAMVFLDSDLHIKRYTQQAKKVIRLIATDVGRPVSDLVSMLHYDRLVEDARDVLRTLVSKEIEVRGEDGASYLMRILPYRTTDNVISGLVLTFVDVTKIKTLQQEQEQLREALHNSLTSVVVQDRDLQITWVSGPVFGKRRSELLGKTDTAMLHSPQAEAVTAVKQAVLANGKPERLQFEVTTKGKPKRYDLYVEPKKNSESKTVGIRSYIVDVTSFSD